MLSYFVHVIACLYYKKNYFQQVIYIRISTKSISLFETWVDEHMRMKLWFSHLVMVGVKESRGGYAIGKNIRTGRDGSLWSVMILDWNSKSDADFKAFQAFFPKLFLDKFFFTHYSVMVFKSMHAGRIRMVAVCRWIIYTEYVKYTLCYLNRLMLKGEYICNIHHL